MMHVMDACFSVCLMWLFCPNAARWCTIHPTILQLFILRVLQSKPAFIVHDPVMSSPAPPTNAASPALFISTLNGPTATVEKLCSGHFYKNQSLYHPCIDGRFYSTATACCIGYYHRTNEGFVSQCGAMVHK